MPQTDHAHNRQVNMIMMSLIAVFIGIVTGLGAVFLRFLIGILHNLFFLGSLSVDYDANLPTPESPFGAWIILAPVIGGLIVVYIVNKYAPEARGHGVPEVMDAIYFGNGRIRPQVVIIKSLASALSIGSGASVGREGPIIQIGAGIGSVLGQIMQLRQWQVITLVAAGAGAGIAATFNTPLGAVMFAIELMLPEFSARTFLPVVLATGAATYVGRLVFGNEPAFLVISYTQHDPFVPLSVDVLPLFVILGVLCGLASWLFIWFLHWIEDRFDAMPTNDYVRNIIAMTSLGVLMYLMIRFTGMYHTAGVGYATIQEILNDGLTVWWLLAVLFFAKLFATCVSLGGGASGGIFSPSLFLGATLGGAFGALLNGFWPHMGFSPVTFALVGMAGIVGGSTGAVMTAIMMIFEMTGDYNIAVAAIIAVACSVGVRRTLSPENIYTMKLARRGHNIPKDRRSHMFPILSAREVMEPVAGVIDIADLDGAPVAPNDIPARPGYALVIRGNRVRGVVLVDPAHPDRPLSSMLSPVGVVREETLLEVIMGRMETNKYAAELVMRGDRLRHPDNVVGLITRQTIADTVLHDYRP